MPSQSGGAGSPKAAKANIKHDMQTLSQASATLGKSGAGSKQVDDKMFGMMKMAVNTFGGKALKKAFNDIASQPGGKEALVSGFKEMSQMMGGGMPGGGGGGNGDDKKDEDSISKMIKAIMNLVKAILRMLGLPMPGDDSGPNMGNMNIDMSKIISNFAQQAQAFQAPQGAQSPQAAKPGGGRCARHA